MKKIGIVTLTTLTPALLVAATLLKTETGYIYPANMKHEDSKYFAYGDKNVFFGNRCHLASDYNRPEGSSIVAIDGGVVEQTSASIPFYGGDDGTPGGALVIKHTTSAGKIFYALYGHIKEITVAKGDTVTAGQAIAKVGPFTSGGKALPHLHFGINPDIPSYEGYTPTSACKDYLGYVNPEEFMKSNHTVAASCKAVDDMATTTKNSILTTVNVLSNDTDVDGDTLTISLADAESMNGVVITNNSDGTFTYTPAVDFVGSDSFKYTVSDGKGCTSQGVVSITITDPDGNDGGSGGNNDDASDSDSGGGDNDAGSNDDNSGSGGGGSMGFLGIISLLFISLIRRKRLIKK